MERKMKLSNETLSVLKNFSGINQGLEFKRGNKLTTVSASKTVLAQAILKDTFPQDFCVYDLNQFLSVHSLFKDKVDLEFDDINIIFKGDRSKLKYRMTAKNMIVSPPDKEIKLTQIDCSFMLTDIDYSEIMKTASVLSSPNISVESDGETIEVVSCDASADGQHTNSIQVGQGNGKIYKIVFKTENIKMVQGTYDVQISFKGFAHFKNTKDDIQYWVAFESKESTF
jgi:hypothetical protein